MFASRTVWLTDPVVRHNVRVESLFSAFNGVFMAMAILAAPVVAVSGVQAGAPELTVIVSAFPVGVFFGPLWASLGRRWGMRRLVTQMAVWANLPLFAIYWVDHSWLFTLLVAIAQVLNSGMRMGQSSMYPVLYPRPIRGRVIGRLTFWTYATMVPSILTAGWLLDLDRESFHVLYPIAGLSGLIGCWFYSKLKLPETGEAPAVATGWRATLTAVGRALVVDRAFRVFQIAYFLSGASFFMSTHVLVLLARDRLGFGPLQLALWLTTVPQLVLAISSPLWGRIYDRLGIVRCRVVISILATVYLASHALGIALRIPALVCAGGVIFGFGNAGGQLTWALGSTHFAPRYEDVPVYNGVHFVLNGVRGLLLPWVGSMLLVLTGPWVLLAATLTSLASVFVSLRSWSIERDDAPEAPVSDVTPSTIASAE